MDRPFPVQIREQRQGPASAILQFLSLYLLVLAFFILLVTISTVEKVRSSAVMDSLTSTFASVLPPSTELTSFTDKSGRILTSVEFQDEIKGLFTTALGVTRVEVVQPGRVMRVLMDADSLFIPGETGIREGQYALLDRIIAALSGSPPGVHFDMEFVIGSRPGEGQQLPTGQTLEVARTGSFVREMLSRGVPPDSVTVGIRPGNPDQIVIWFYVRTTEEIEDFYRHLADAEQAGPATNAPPEAPAQAPAQGPTGAPAGEGSGG